MKTDIITHYFSCRLSNIAVRILGICLFMWAGIMPLSAQVYSTAQRGTQYEVRDDAQLDMQYYGDQVQHTQATQAYNPYQSTVYQPFGTSLPSESTLGSSSGGDSEGSSFTPTNRQNAFPSRPDTNPSPVGEAWVMLFFAAAAAVVVFVRQRKAAVRG